MQASGRTVAVIVDSIEVFSAVSLGQGAGSIDSRSQEEEDPGVDAQKR